MPCSRSWASKTRLVSPEEVGELAPMIQLFPEEATAWEPRSGYADPYLVTTSYASRAREMGAEIALRTPVSGVEISGGRVRAVITEQGRVETPVAVVAAGPWARPLLSPVGINLPLSTVRHQVAVLTRPVDQLPQHPAVGDIAQSFSFRPDGAALTMLGFGEDEVDPDTYNQGVDMPDLADAMGRLARRMPAMGDSYYRGRLVWVVHHHARLASHPRPRSGS